MSYEIETTKTYDKWFDGLNKKTQAQVEKRLSKIKNDGHFGHLRDLGDGLAEIKFNNGNRIYFAKVQDKGKTIILILGGNKNGQSKDIKKAKAFLD